MGISALMVEWLSRLSFRRIINQGMSIIDLGPQDIFTTRNVVDCIARRHLTNVDDVMSTIFMHSQDGNAIRGKQSNLYGIFGLGPYSSLDSIDPTATIKLDLNCAFRCDSKFSVVTNFGTSEHIFNIAQSFAAMDELLAPGGVSLLVLPAFGHINHGFYNIHPTVYYDIALCNNYSIDDIVYVDNFGVRCRVHERSSVAPFDFDSLPIKLDRTRTQHAGIHDAELARQVALQFVRNMNDTSTLIYGNEFPPIVYDYCFVAMRKSSRESAGVFKFPTQGMYASM